MKGFCKEVWWESRSLWFSPLFALEEIGYSLDSRQVLVRLLLKNKKKRKKKKTKTKRAVRFDRWVEKSCALVTFPWFPELKLC